MAEKLDDLFRKQKKIFREIQSLRQFREPALLLIRRDNNVEFFEDARGIEFVYRHSSGQERRIQLTNRNLMTFEYGNKTFRGYICHEDFPFPLPEDPLFLTEEIEVIFDKLWTANDNLKSRAVREWGNLIWKIALGIAVVIGMFILWKILVPPVVSNPAPAVSGAVNYIAQNATILG